MLDADSRAGERVRPARDVAGCENAGDARLKILAHADAAIDSKSCLLCQQDRGSYGDADHDEVDLEEFSRVECDVVPIDLADTLAYSRDPACWRTSPSCVSLRQLEYFIQPLGKFRGLHVIRVATKRGVAPDRVARVSSNAAAPAECLYPLIGQTLFDERVAQCSLPILRTMPRPRMAAHIDDGSDAISRDQRKKLVQRPRRMADRPNAQFSFHGRYY
jgi:hypothetical protein